MRGFTQIIIVSLEIQIISKFRFIYFLERERKEIGNKSLLL
jgi:hypothetical protein